MVNGLLIGLVVFQVTYSFSNVFENQIRAFITFHKSCFKGEKSLKSIIKDLKREIQLKIRRIKRGC